MQIQTNMRNFQHRSLSTFLIVVLFLITASHIEAGKVSPRISLTKVKASGEIGRRIDATVYNNLMVIDVDGDFLDPFRERNRKNGGYIGLGKLIDSLVRVAAYTGDPEVVARKNYVVNETLKTQETDGYIGLFVPEKRMWTLWDIHEMAYLANGLVTDYFFFDNKTSLDGAARLIDYVIRRWSANPEGLDSIDITVFMAVTGLEETLLMLYEATNDEQYLDFCVDFRELPEWDAPIVLGRWGKIGGHAYAYFHRCLAQLRLHQMEGGRGLLEQTRNTMDFLFNRDGLLINGVCGQHECWTDTQDGTAGLGETCATAYMIRVLDELIRMQEESLYGDIMERAVYNGLFAAQSPDGRYIRYYVPFEGKREYFHGDTYCCPCNYRRIVADLPSMIYYRMDGGLAVNLYTPSELSIMLDDETHLNLVQETDYPNSGSVTINLSLSESDRFPLYFRIPRWCKTAQIVVNGETVEDEAEGGSFFRIRREWKSGDRIEIHMPMEWRLIKGREAQAGRVAVMRGPQLFCLNRKNNEPVWDTDLRQIAIDPGSIEGPFPDNTIRPDGIACKIKGWKEMSFSRGNNPDTQFFLTEFPDPEGEATYFRIHKLGQAGMEDELYRPE